MSVPVGVDGVLWQQAVELGARACFNSEGHSNARWDSIAESDRVLYLTDAAVALAVAFPVLQQATRQQIADEIESLIPATQKAMGYSTTSASALAEAARVARGETPEATNG